MRKRFRFWVIMRLLKLTTYLLDRLSEREDKIEHDGHTHTSQAGLPFHAPGESLADEDRRDFQESIGFLIDEESERIRAAYWERQERLAEEQRKS